jgi:acyl-CoA thioester hydrolase
MDSSKGETGDVSQDYWRKRPQRSDRSEGDPASWHLRDRTWRENMIGYSRTYEIRWSDLDANGHVNYAAYIDAAGDLRYRFFTGHGFPPERFSEMGIGPIYTTIQAEFLREVRLGESVTITYALSGLSPSGMRWKVHHDVLKSNGKKATIIELEGTILDLSTRKPVLPTPELVQVFNLVPRTSNFNVLSEFRWIRGR